MIEALVFLAVLGLIVGAGLAFASIKFHVDIDERTEKLENMLPGTNCGACGYPGCNGYAAALVNEGAKLTLCAPGGAELARQIGEFLGQKVEVSDEKEVAFVYCNGGDLANDSFGYSGEPKCNAATLVNGGHKDCQFGCLGFGDCVIVCKFDAMYMGKNKIPVIKNENCVACEACVEACPKGIIKMIPWKEVRQVVCASFDPGKIAKAACKVACIGCGICVKNCPYEAITMKNALAEIDVIKCTNCGICEEKCPTKAIK